MQEEEQQALRSGKLLPHEHEALYPPLTFFKPIGKPEDLEYDGCRFTIVDVRPTFPS